MTQEAFKLERKKQLKKFWPVWGGCSPSSSSVCATGASPSACTTLPGGASLPSSSKTESEKGKKNNNSNLKKINCHTPTLCKTLLLSDSPFMVGVSRSKSGWGGGVELMAFRSGVLASGDGELRGSGVGVRSGRGEPVQGTGEGLFWDRRSRSFSCSWASKA